MSTDGIKKLIEWTPAKEAEIILDNLLGVWLHWEAGNEADFRTGFLETARETIEKHGDLFNNPISKVYTLNNSPIVKSENDEVFVRGLMNAFEHTCFDAIKALDSEDSSQLAWMHACRANNSLGMLMGLIAGGKAEIEMAQIRDLIGGSERGKEMAKNRWEGHATRKAKEFAKECWDEWKRDPSRYSNQPEFVNDVLAKIEVKKDGKPVITFNTIMKKYIPEWNRLD